MTHAKSHIRRKQSQGQHDLDTLDSSTAGSALKIIKCQSQRGDRTLGSEDKRQSRQERIGGILNQLRWLQKEHIAYVEAHGQRLEKHLQENRLHKQQFVEKSEALEEHLLELLQQQSDESVDLEHLE